MAAVLLLGAIGGLLLVHRRRLARIREEACRLQLRSGQDDGVVPQRPRRRQFEPRCTFEPFGPEYDGGLVVAIMPFLVTLVFLKLVIFRSSSNKPSRRQGDGGDHENDNDNDNHSVEGLVSGLESTVWVEPRKESENAVSSPVLPVLPSSVKACDNDHPFPTILDVVSAPPPHNKGGDGMRIDTKVEGWLWDDDGVGVDLGEVLDVDDPSPNTATVATMPLLEPLQDLSPLDASPRDVISPPSTYFSDGAASMLPKSPEKEAQQQQPESPGRACKPSDSPPPPMAQPARMGSLKRGPLSALVLPTFVPELESPEFAGFVPPPPLSSSLDVGEELPQVLSSSWDAAAPSKPSGVDAEGLSNMKAAAAPLLCHSNLVPLEPLPLPLLLPGDEEEEVQCVPPHVYSCTLALSSPQDHHVPHPVTPLAPIASLHSPAVVWSKDGRLGSQKEHCGKSPLGEAALAGETGGVDSECLENWIAALGPMDSPRRQGQQQQQQGGPLEEEQWRSVGGRGGLDSDGLWQLKSGRGPLGASNITSSSTVLDRRKLHRALAVLAARQASGEPLFVQGGRRRDRHQHGMVSEDSSDYSEGDDGAHLRGPGHDMVLAGLAPGTDKGALEDDEDEENSDPELVLEDAETADQKAGGARERAVAEASLEEEDDLTARRLHASPVIWGLQGPNSARLPDSGFSEKHGKERGENCLDDASLLSSPACPVAPSTLMGSLRQNKQPEEAGAFRFIVPGPLSSLLRDAQLSLLDEDDTSWDWGASDAASSPQPSPPPAVLASLDRRDGQIEDHGANGPSPIETQGVPASCSRSMVAASVAAQEEATAAVCDWSPDSSDVAAVKQTGLNPDAVLEESPTVAQTVVDRGSVNRGVESVADQMGDRERRVQVALTALGGGGGREDHPRSSRHTRHHHRVRRLLRRSSSVGALNRNTSTTSLSVGGAATRRDAQVWSSSGPRRRSFGYEGNHVAAAAWMKSAPVGGRPDTGGGAWSPASIVAAEKTNGHCSPEWRARSSLAFGPTTRGLRFADWQDKECVEELSEDQQDPGVMRVGPAEVTRRPRVVAAPYEQDEDVEEPDESARPSRDSGDGSHGFSSVREDGTWEEEGKGLGLGRARRGEAKSLMEEDEEDPKLSAEMRSILIRAKLAANKVTALHAQIMQLSTSPLPSRPSSPTQICG